MITVAGHFEQVSKLISVRLADVFGASVAIVDDRGVLVAGSDRGAAGQIAQRERANPSDLLRLPVRIASRSAEVVLPKPANGEEISPRLAQVLVELVVNQSTVVDRLPNQQQLKSKFIHDLLRGPVDDEATILREGQILGMDFTRPRAVILIDAGEYLGAPGGRGRATDDERVRRRAQLVIASIVGFFDLPDDTICAYIGNGEIAVLKASTSRDLADWVDQRDRPDAGASWANLNALKRAAGGLLERLRRDTGAPVSIGVGRYHPGIRGMARSYGDARAALMLGLQVHGQNRVHCLAGLGVASFVGLADERTKADLAAHLLSPLDHAGELIQTLGVFFREDCCPSSTSRRLEIHRNTLSYRLDKIASLTGLDPRRFDDAVQIRLALLLRSLHSHDSRLGERPSIPAQMPRRVGHMPNDLP